MTRHAKYALRGASVSQVVNLPLAVAAFEAVRAECLVTCEDGQVFYLVAAGAAAVCAVVADERAVAEEEEICIGVEKRATRVAAKAVNVPSVPSCVNTC